MNNKNQEEVEYLRDEVASIIFTDEYCRDYVVKVVSKALEIPEDIIQNNLKLITPRVNANVRTQYSYVDAIYENDTSYINLEINYANSNHLQNKNIKYVCQMVLRQTNIGEKIKLKPIYQIHINNFDIFHANKFIYRSNIREENLNLRRDDFITIVDINVDFLSKISYNDFKEEDRDSLEYLLYIFIKNEESVFDELYLNDCIMDKVREKLNNLTDDFDNLLYYNKEELWNDVSYEMGEKEGIEKRNIEIAKNMLKMNFSIEDISTATNLTKEEVENLKEE